MSLCLCVSRQDSGGRPSQRMSACVWWWRELFKSENGNQSRGENEGENGRKRGGVTENDVLPMIQPVAVTEKSSVEHIIIIIVLMYMTFSHTVYSSETKCNEIKYYL